MTELLLRQFGIIVLQPPMQLLPSPAGSEACAAARSALSPRRRMAAARLCLRLGNGERGQLRRLNDLLLHRVVIDPLAGNRYR